MALKFKYAMKAKFGSVMREKFRNATGLELYRLAAKIQAYQDAGDLSDAEMRTLFDLSMPQWATLKGKIKKYADAWNAMQNEVGE